jgi:uncharacterized membrane protein
MTPFSDIPFRRGAVEPVECLKAGWNVISDQYWLFLGMVAVAMIIGSAVPLGILAGPMFCGLYLVYFRKRRGLPIEFGTLFKGFDYFGQSVVASLLHYIPIVVIVVFCYILMYVGMFATMFAASQAGEEAAPFAMLSFLVVMLIFYAVVMLLVILISIGFMFAYPLIVDRGLAGLDAVKLSFRAAFANFWRLLGLSLLCGLLTFVGYLMCFVGIFFVLPITYVGMAAAYEQVFGLSQPGDLATNLPPPPPTF